MTGEGGGWPANSASWSRSCASGKLGRRTRERDDWLTGRRPASGSEARRTRTADAYPQSSAAATSTLSRHRLHGQRGRTCGQERLPPARSVASYGTYVYVADAYNSRIMKHNASDLAYVSRVGSQGNGPNQFTNPGGVAVSGSIILVADSYNHRIVKRGAQ